MHASSASLSSSSKDSEDCWDIFSSCAESSSFARSRINFPSLYFWLFSCAVSCKFHLQCISSKV